MAENETKDQGKEEAVGFVYQSLARSNKAIRAERGEALAEQLETSFRRNVEDLRYNMRDLERTRANMYDFSPNTSHSLVMAKEVNASAIMEKDGEISLDIRDLRIKLDIAEARYMDLFGKTVA